MATQQGRCLRWRETKGNRTFSRDAPIVTLGEERRRRLVLASLKPSKPSQRCLAGAMEAFSGVAGGVTIVALAGRMRRPPLQPLFPATTRVALFCCIPLGFTTAAHEPTRDNAIRGTYQRSRVSASSLAPRLDALCFEFPPFFRFTPRTVSSLRRFTPSKNYYLLPADGILLLISHLLLLCDF